MAFLIWLTLFATNSKRMKKHIPVLKKEVIEALNLKNNGIYIDATFGAGGHTEALLETNNTISVIALDWDKKSIETYGPPLQEQFGSRLMLEWSNFALIHRVMKKLNIKSVDGILADFGTSLMHFKERAGFSFHTDTPLDMRMSPAHQKITAHDILMQASLQELTHILNRGGEEQWAYKIAQKIVATRKNEPLETTSQLAHLVEYIIGKKKNKIHPATKTFQAIRIAVNKEIENIHGFLINAIPFLKKDGRFVCISFHSLEDQEVKNFFLNSATEKLVKIITKKPIVPSPEEVEENSSSRSAKLRIAEKLF